ncbi:MAG: helix-turn-helix transcriptional regulator [Clostridia bacterium]|nr:helix-turn-helix transcriptional regulator [Clostridia bacterium]
MFFEKDNAKFTIMGVVALDQTHIKRYNAGRSFDALSYRYSADTELTTERGTYHVTDNCVTFVPKFVNYERNAKKDTLIAINLVLEDSETDDIEFFIPKDPVRLASLFKELLDCWEKKDKGYVYRCYALVYRILAECCVQYATEEQSIPKIQDAVNYINSNYTNSELSVKSAAARSYMSEVYFRKLFRERFNTSPVKYIIKLRLRRAMELMATGDYPLKEVALLSGYKDYKYFSSEFKRETGLSPSEFVRNIPESYGHKQLDFSEKARGDFVNIRIRHP